MIPWLIKILNPELEPIADGAFREGFEFIITAANNGMTREEEKAQKRCLHKAYLKSKQRLTEAIGQHEIDQMSLWALGNFEKSILADIGEGSHFGSDMESEHSYRSGSSVSLDEMDQNNIWRETNALDIGDQAVIRSWRSMVDRRFSHYPRHEAETERIHRRNREERGAKTATLYHRVYID